jgi:hypothetical protein
MAEVAEMAGGKKSAWMKHVKMTMKAHKGKSLAAVLKMAAKTYKKKRGGAGEPAPFSESGDITPAGPNNASPNAPVRDAAPVGGRRRRHSRKTRRGGDEMEAPMGGRRRRHRSRKH